MFDLLKVVGVIVVMIAVNLAWIAAVIWIGANIVKSVFGS
jgi:hypothetical protein